MRPGVGGWVSVGGSLDSPRPTRAATHSLVSHQFDGVGGPARGSGQPSKIRLRCANRAAHEDQPGLAGGNDGAEHMGHDFRIMPRAHRLRCAAWCLGVWAVTDVGGGLVDGLLSAEGAHQDLRVTGHGRSHFSRASAPEQSEPARRLLQLRQPHAAHPPRRFGRSRAWSPRSASWTRVMASSWKAGSTATSRWKSSTSPRSARRKPIGWRRNCGGRCNRSRTPWTSSTSPGR